MAVTYSVKQIAIALRWPESYVQDKFTRCKEPQLCINEADQPDPYNTIEVNGWRVCFRFRDDNRIKVASVTHVEDCSSQHRQYIKQESMLDDCNGQQFATYIARLFLEPEA